MSGQDRLRRAFAAFALALALLPVPGLAAAVSPEPESRKPERSVVVPLMPAETPQLPKGTVAPEGLAVFDDWKKLCQPSPDRAVKICFGFQKVSYNETKAQLLQVVVGYFRSDRTDPTLIVTIPLGAYLLPGLEIRMAGKKPIRSDFQYCFSNGCQAAMRLDAAKLASLRQDGEAEVVFLDAGHQRISVPLSLKGFPAVLDALKPGAGAN